MGLFDRQVHGAPPAASSPAPEPGSSLAVANAAVSLTSFLRRESGRVPGRAYVLARTIARHLDAVGADPSSHLIDAGTRISLQRMGDVHVPETIEAYLGARTVPNADAMLVDQLSTMERVAAKAAARSIEAARDAFLIQGSFLEDKYGSAHA